MYEYNFPEGDFLRSSDFYDSGQSERTVRWDLNTILEGFLWDERMSDFIGWHGLLGNRRNHLVLEAHGASNSDLWQYRDSGYSNSLQGFVNEHDGRYAAILLCVCNRHNAQISSRNSLVFHFDRDVYPEELESGVNIRIYVPKLGYLNHLQSVLPSIGAA